MAYPSGNENIHLNKNEIYSLLDNMIISQQTFTDPVGGLSTEIVDSNRVDGTLFGDQKRYTSVDMIHPVDWGNDDEAENLLKLNRNKNVKTEAIILDKFKMFKLTTDAMLTKQAFMSEGNFSNYNAVQLSMIRDGKKAYDVTTFDAFLGTHATQTKQITVPAGTQYPALVLAQGVADILDDMSELSREYNANKFLRAFSKSDVSIVFNKKYLNAWKYLDLPIVFHKDGILADHKAMNARYFGHVATSADKGSNKVINASDEYDATKGTLRFAEAINVKLGGEDRSFYAGDEVPTKKLDGSTALTVTVGAGKDLEYAQVYVEDADIVGLIVGNGAIPFMSASENSTAFWNPQSLTTTNFLIWGHNTLKALGEKPYIVIKKA